MTKPFQRKNYCTSCVFRYSFVDTVTKKEILPAGITCWVNTLHQQRVVGTDSNYSSNAAVQLYFVRIDMCLLMFMSVE